MSGRVVLVGAGPGDPDLLTVRAARELGCAEVLLYDALIEPALLELAPADCERIDVGKRGDGTRGLAQEQIADLMIERARAGRSVVRLKGGDPFVFGRGGEEASALAAAGIAFEVVPGITSAQAVPAYAGIPLTDRRHASSFAVLTGHRADRPDQNDTDWEGLATRVDTLIVLMGTSWLEQITSRVLAGGRDPATPVAVIEHGTTARQRVVRGRLDEVARLARETGVRAPTVIVIGEVAGLHEALRWYELRPLFGRRVLVLRAHEQRGELVERLASAGAQAVCVPLLRFEACDDAPLDGADFDWILFSSANAVRFALPLLSGLSGRPPAARIACVGEATAGAARDAGLRVDLVPEASADPEALVRELARQGPVRGVRLLLPRVVGAHEALPEALERAGARVVRRAIYRNVLPGDAEIRLRKVLEEGIDAVLLTSPSTVERLTCLLGREGFGRLARESVLVSIGPTTAAALREAGGDGPVAETASVEGLVRALEQQLAG